MEEMRQRLNKAETDIAKIETTVDEHTRLLTAQTEKNDTLTRLATLLEREMEDSKERERRQEIRDKAQSKQMEKFSETLTNVNQNLTILNSKQELLDERVTGIETTLTTEKKNRKQNIIKSIKYIGSLLIGVFLAWLYKKLGL